MEQTDLGRPSHSEVVYGATYEQKITAMQSEVMKREGNFTALNRSDCLVRYTQTNQDASDVILVSSSDIPHFYDTARADDDSLLSFGNERRPLTPDLPWWPCGVSNSFSCSHPDVWQQNESVIADWNVFGYRIDYCLSSEKDLGMKCSVKLYFPIIMGEHFYPSQVRD